MAFFWNQLKTRPASNGTKSKKLITTILSIDAVTQPMQVREGEIPYGDREKGHLGTKGHLRAPGDVVENYHF
jgi:hypothetical protein